MAVAVDVLGTTFHGTASPLSSSTSINVGASATGLLVSIQGDDATTVVSGITWGGTALTKIGDVQTTDTACRGQLWGLLSPASGSQALVVTFAGGAANIDVCAISFTGGQTSTIAAAFTGFVSQINNTATTTSTVTVSSNVGDYTIGVGNGNVAGFSMNQTAWYTGASPTFSSVGTRATGAASVVYTGTLASSVTNLILGINIAAGAGGGVVTLGGQAEFYAPRLSPEFRFKPTLAFPPPTSPDLSISITGVSATALAGTASIAINETPLGVSATTSAGTIIPSVTEIVAGVTATSAAGTIIPSVTDIATGVVATSTAGSIIFRIDDNVPLVGVSATASAGSVAVPAGLHFSSTYNTGSTIPLPPHAAGDIIVIYAIRDDFNTPTTAPTVPGTFTSLGSQTAQFVALSAGYRVATSSSEVSDTWTNADGLFVEVYRSTDGAQLHVGAFAVTRGIKLATLTWSALSLVKTNNTSWVAGAAILERIGSTVGPPTGFTTRQENDTGLFGPGGDASVASYDTNGTVSSWSSTSISLGALYNWVSVVLEIYPDPPATGVQVTASAGTVTVTTTANITPTGVQANTFAGTVSPKIDSIITGVQANTAAQSVIISISVTGNGALATTAAGNIIPNPAKTINGVSVTANAGALIANVQQIITGVLANANAGAITPAISVIGNGVFATANAGTVSITASSNATVTGIAATANAGTVIANVQVIANGVQSNTSAGAITPSVNAFVTGVSATANAGVLKANVLITIIGAQSTSNAGTVTITASANAAITGVQANANPGTVSIVIGSQVTVPGVQANAAAGTVTDTISSNVSVTGVQANAAAGTVTTTSSVNKTAIGVQATANAGTVSIVTGTTVNVTGVQANAAAGTVTISISANVNVTGVQSTANAGIVVPSVNAFVTGVKANTAAGTVTVTIITTTNGVQANAASGTVAGKVDVTSLGTQIVVTAGNLTQVIAKIANGAQATANAGTVTTTSSVSANANVTGVQANSAAGVPTPSLSAVVNVNGAQANASAGSVQLASRFVTITGAQVIAAAGFVKTYLASMVPTVTIRMPQPTSKTVRFSSGTMSNNWITVSPASTNSLVHLNNRSGQSTILLEKQPQASKIIINRGTTGNNNV